MATSVNLPRDFTAVAASDLARRIIISSLSFSKVESDSFTEVLESGDVILTFFLGASGSFGSPGFFRLPALC